MTAEEADGREKLRLASEVFELASDIVQVTIDSDWQIGLVVMRWPGLGAIHLPANSPIGQPRELAA